MNRSKELSILWENLQNNYGFSELELSAISSNAVRKKEDVFQEILNKAADGIAKEDILKELNLFEDIKESTELEKLEDIFNSFGFSKTYLRQTLRDNNISAEAFSKIINDTVRTSISEKITQKDFSDTTDISSFTGKNWRTDLVGNYIINKYHACIVGEEHPSLLIYMNGVYVRGEKLIHTAILDIDPTASTHKRREVCEYIKSSSKTPHRELAPVNLIPFKSKVYDLNTRQLIEYSPEYVFLNKLPYDYKADAPAQPLIDKLFKDLTLNDPSVQNLFFEAIGHCFYRSCEYRGTIILYGDKGNNGKSTLLNAIKQVIGENNCSFLSLQDINEKFRVGDLFGKLANIGDDIPKTKLTDDTLFKKITGVGTLYIEQKGENIIAFKNYAKCFFSCNEIPQSDDKTESFLSRLLIVPMNAHFVQGQQNCNVNLVNRKWTDAEMEYLTCLAVKGLHRLLEQGTFTKPICVIRALSDYQAENDTVKDYLDTIAKVDENKKIISNPFEGMPVKTVYDDYVKHCESCGYKAMNTKQFGRRFREMTGTRTKPGRPIDGDGIKKVCKVYTYKADQMEFDFSDVNAMKKV